MVFYLEKAFGSRRAWRSEWSRLAKCDEPFGDYARSLEQILRSPLMEPTSPDGGKPRSYERGYLTRLFLRTLRWLIGAS